MGDMNYRMNTTFAEFNNSNVSTDAVGMIPTHDQLVISMLEGNYAGYQEPKIEHLPSYKMDKKKDIYIDKKDQAPSYCDRIIYRNNSELKIEEELYDCMHSVKGSDHRPVVLGLKIRSFDQP